ncbi:MAG: hypothetical protein QM648_06130 [Solirubrobacterales bacterium]
MRRRSLIVVFTIALLSAASATPAGATKPAKFEHPFGASAWARIPLPFSRSSISIYSCDFTPQRKILVSGEKSDSTAFIERLSSRGRVDQSFGKRGTVSLTRRQAPDELGLLKDGSILSISGGSTTTSPSRVYRILKSGRIDRHFSDDGVLATPKGDRIDSWYPELKTFPKARYFGLLYTSHMPDSNSQMRAYDFDGKRTRVFPGGSLIKFPFQVLGFKTDSAGGHLVTGSRVTSGSAKGLVLARYDERWRPIPTWGTNGIVDLGPAIGSIMRGSRPRFSQGDAGMESAAVQQLKSGGFHLVMEFYNEHAAYAMRLSADGTLDRSWGNQGTTYLGGYLEGSDEDDDFYWAWPDSLASGRTLYWLFTRSGTTYETHSRLRVWGENGQLTGASGREIVFHNIDVQSAGFFDSDTRALICADRRGAASMSVLNIG